MKLRIIIGEHIENMSRFAFGRNPVKDYWFPECKTDDMSGDAVSLHANNVALAYMNILDATKLCSDVAIITHSELIVSMTGQLISQGKLNSEDVTVCMYNAVKPLGNQDPDKVFTFDNEGILCGGWPYGWFMANF